MDAAQRNALRDWLCGAAGADDVTIVSAERLAGGATMRAWLEAYVRLRLAISNPRALTNFR